METGSNGRLRYYIGANYPNSTTLIPNNLTMEIRNQVTGSSVFMSFENTDGGGSNGTNEKNRGVSFLTGQGCNQGPQIDASDLSFDEKRMKGGWKDLSDGSTWITVGEVTATQP